MTSYVVKGVAGYYFVGYDIMLPISLNTIWGRNKAVYCIYKE